MLRRRQFLQSQVEHNQLTSETPIQPLGDIDYKDAREVLLEEEVLGDGDNVIEALPSSEEKDKKRKRRKRKLSQGEEVKKWEDSDDEQVVEFETAKPNWAEKFEDEKSDDSDEEILKAHSHRNLEASVTLPSSALEFKRVTDGNKEDPSKASLRSVEFHPSATVLLTGGPDQTVRLFAVDGNKNRKIHSMFIEKNPVFCTHFSRGGSEIIIGSKRKSFLVFDMEGNSGVTYRPKIKGLEVKGMSKFVVSPDGRFIAFLGKFGYIHLFSQTSKELIDSVKMNEEVSSVCFSSNGKYMYSFGSEGRVYVWDMDTRDCVHHFSDEGCINGVTVAASPDNNYLVCGSKSGIVTIYDRETAMSTRHPKPLKHIKNLTTKCTGALFNPQSELLALRSKDTEKAIRLVHFPSLTVLPNFPEQFDNDIHTLLSMDFSPSSGYLALGNNKGRCLLYRLQHYTKY
ncbi:U3 small nucleolar RNA-associated protein 18 homolog [Physella acuta]|uniref:U3 small nucleolar RNA-associated protein 18 homolog n=1 Tax=Physella acuta TaxID=109671 RepID=UPI0027DE628C|nr:U3 small nucleolar RNA-associated protein 18 homolog [Physella acuta]XP_059178029.1 U3 small nucleolar RNA-associated protein 18 homolog [Physella acuta]XP_059178030.1 U3 small nucleolar RNA-associated protein 18 homolog [Physella acuta]XP_059178031.1 U3 small nucleolar RNA-associated protein 18 homolog [Physella acuta]